MSRKKKILTLSIIVLVSVVLIYMFQERPCKPFEKPTSLPEKTYWFGDCDGGNWIELVNTDKQRKIIRFKIYRDYDGVLQMDANFKLGSCSFNDINRSNWKEKIVGYINETISLKGDKNCFLKPVYPAFGGEEWEILRTKNDNVPDGKGAD